MLVTKIFTRNASSSDKMEEEISKWLQFKKLVSITSSSTIDDDAIYVTVVLVAEDESSQF